MERIGPVGSARTGRVEAIRPTAPAAETPRPPSRALVVIEGGRPGDARTSSASLRDGRAEAGFVTQLLVGADPTLAASRPIRARQAADRYAETARLLA